MRNDLDIVEIIDAGLETLSNLVTIALFLFKTSLMLNEIMPLFNRSF